MSYGLDTASTTVGVRGNLGPFFAEHRRTHHSAGPIHRQEGERAPGAYGAHGVLDTATKRNIACVVSAVVLTALAAVAAYYLMSTGFHYLDLANITGRTLHFAGGAFSLCMGGVFAVVAVANICVPPVRYGCCKKEYTEEEAAWQWGLSVAAPVVGTAWVAYKLLPYILMHAICGDGRR